MYFLLDNLKKEFGEDGNKMGNLMKSQLNFTKVYEESIIQHKYARLARSAYDNFYSKNEDHDYVHKELSKEEFSHIKELQDFKVDKDLTTVDNVVLHNGKTGETHVAFRGTSNDALGKGDPITFLNDWKMNGETLGGSLETSRMIEAREQMEQVIEKYSKEKLTVSGHSVGGNISYEMAVTHDLEGYHYNPAINGTQINNTGLYRENKAGQTVYKTRLDFASPLAYQKEALKDSNTEVTIVNNLVGKDDIVETHSLQQFYPKPKEVITNELEDVTLKIERRTVLSSSLKGLASYLNFGMYVYSASFDLKEDFELDLDDLDKTAYVLIDKSALRKPLKPR